MDAELGCEDNAGNDTEERCQTIGGCHYEARKLDEDACDADEHDEHAKDGGEDGIVDGRRISGKGSSDNVGDQGQSEQSPKEGPRPDGRLGD